MINSKEISSGILRSIGVLALLFISLIFIYKIQTILVYLIISIIFSLIANPVVAFLKQRLRFSNTLAVVTTLLIFMFFLVGLIMLFVPLITSQSDNLSLLDTNSIKSRTIELYGQIDSYLSKRGLSLNNLIKETDLTSKLNFTFLTDFFNSIIGTLSSLGIGLASTFFITFFLLKDKTIFLVGIQKLIPISKEEKILNSADKTKQMLTRYFVGLIIQLVIVCCLDLIVLLIFGVQNAFVIAFLCAILNIIPYIGPLIGAFLAAILTMLSNINNDFQTVTLPATLYVFVGFIIVHLLDSNISSPIIFSKSVNSHPLELFLVILIIGTLFGITGMIVAIPLYTILKIIGKEFFPENKFIKLLTKNI